MTGNPTDLDIPQGTEAVRANLRDSFAETYWTGCQAHILLNGSDYLGQAYGVAYNMTFGKSPIYGHRSTYYDRVARGQALVQGMILVNLIDYRYMESSVGFTTGVLARPRRNTELDQQEALFRKLPSLRSLSPVEAEWVYKQAVSGLEPADEDPGRALIAESPLLVGPDGLADPSANRLSIAGLSMAALHRSAFDVVLVLGDPNDVSQPWHSRVNSTMRKLVGVQIVGESSEVMAKDDVLLQAFPFIARSLDYNQGVAKLSMSRALASQTASRDAALDAILREAALDPGLSTQPLSDTASQFVVKGNEKQRALIQRFVDTLAKYGVTALSTEEELKELLPSIVVSPEFMDDLIDIAETEFPSGGDSLYGIVEMIDRDRASIDSGGSPGEFSSFLEKIREVSPNVGPEDERLGRQMALQAKYGAVKDRYDALNPEEIQPAKDDYRPRSILEGLERVFDDVFGLDDTTTNP